MFDATKFLRENFKTPASLVAFLAAFGIRAPALPAVEKWFLRAAIPGSWFPVLLAVLELDRSSPVSMAQYLTENKDANSK